MENRVDIWISRIVGGLIALCVIIVFCAAPFPALLGLLGIFVMEAVIGYIRKLVAMMLTNALRHWVYVCCIFSNKYAHLTRDAPLFENGR